MLVRYVPWTLGRLVSWSWLAQGYRPAHTHFRFFLPTIGSTFTRRWGTVLDSRLGFKGGPEPSILNDFCLANVVCKLSFGTSKHQPELRCWETHLKFLWIPVLARLFEHEFDSALSISFISIVVKSPWSLQYLQKDLFRPVAQHARCKYRGYTVPWSRFTLTQCDSAHETLLAFFVFLQFNLHWNKNEFSKRTCDFIRNLGLYRTRDLRHHTG